MHKQTHDFIWNIIVEVNCECICEAACVLTYECVSQFCLNEGEKKRERMMIKIKQHRIHYHVFMCLYSVYRLSRYTDTSP